MTPSQEDAQHLKWLMIGHYVYAGFITFWSMFGLFFAFMGFTIGNLPQPSGNPPPPAIGYMFAAIGVVITLMFLGMAVAIVLAGRNLGRRKHHLFCLIMAGLDCMWFPLGTALGAFSFAVLLRPSVKELFGEFDARPPSVPDAP